MRYLITARIRSGQEAPLLRAVETGTLGAGSVAGDEYVANMQRARWCEDRTARWIEVCFCTRPLDEERPYWEEFFELVRIQPATSRRKCRDETGEQPWACTDCDCTAKLASRMQRQGESFLETLRVAVSQNRTLRAAWDE
jgi:hypothetical protein